MRRPPQALVDSIKEEILMDLRRFGGRGWGPAPTDRALAESVKAQVLWELGENRRPRNTYSNYPEPDAEDIARAIVDEARYRGPNSTFRFRPETGPGKLHQPASANDGRIKGLLYGLGTAALAALVLPSVRKKLHSVALKTAEDGLDIFDRARSMLTRAKEGVEDVFAEASFNRFQADIMKEFDTPAEPPDKQG